jgi:hypothetical protein
MKKIKLTKDFLPKLHQLIFDNSNTNIGVEIDVKCREFINILESCNYEANNN